MGYNSFEEMPVWQKAIKLAVSIFKLTEKLPKKEDYGLTLQYSPQPQPQPQPDIVGSGNYKSSSQGVLTFEVAYSGSVNQPFFPPRNLRVQ